MLDLGSLVGYPMAMSSDLVGLSLEQLKQAIAVKEKIAVLESELAALLGGGSAAPTPTPVRRRKKHILSPAARKAISAAQKARWAKQRGAVAPAPAAVPAKPKRKMSPAGRARLATLARARWKAARAAGKTKLS